MAHKWKDLKHKNPWVKKGHTEYRKADRAEIINAVVRNVDADAIYLTKKDFTLETYVVLSRDYVVYLNGQDDPIFEYRLAHEH